ncbi:SH3 domain-containing protein [Niallia nealsonii]|uniref:SH3b domain-containing protein n=1 Tax=Niallia nealsonii TaxID=115979 RepID=A0A2N0Z3Y5_9BACI|nr:SH3 domain-containing protein [Niallia nealsonii]PKG24231.1 hypothetical protein CWS01_07520 [Niallia nealsonii]
MKTIKKIMIFCLIIVALPFYSPQENAEAASAVTETTFISQGTITEPSGFNVRSKPSASSTRLGGVYKNNTVNIVAKSGDWYKIKFGNGYGYIMAVKSGLVLIKKDPGETPFTAQGRITEPSGFNVRSKPNASSTRLGGVYKNNTVNIVAKSGDWYKIKFGNGYGYIMAVKNGLTLVTPPDPNKLASYNTFLNILSFTLKWEGGYVDNKLDPGGRTNKGITQRVYTNYLKGKKLADKNVKYITDAEVKDIYYSKFWTPLKLNSMNEKLAMIMFDTAVNVGPNGNNSGAGGAIKFLQQAMGITADGSWGPKTEAAFKKQPLANHNQLASKVMQLRIDFRYVRVKQNPSQKTFLEGWLNRDNALKKFVGI